jgi:type IV secretory pathway component VirB8
LEKSAMIFWIIGGIVSVLALVLMILLVMGDPE